MNNYVLLPLHFYFADFRKLDGPVDPDKGNVSPVIMHYAGVPQNIESRVVLEIKECSTTLNRASDDYLEELLGIACLWSCHLNLKRLFRITLSAIYNYAFLHIC